MDLINLNSFLKFGYFLDYENPNIKFDFSGIEKEKYKNIPGEELIGIGIKLWKNAIQEQFKTNKKHVVPLSGGLDSRAILAGLLEFTEAKNIYTYTFGSPDTYDYIIGNLVATKIGTNHSSFPLNQYIFTLQKEIKVSKRIDHQTFLFHHPPLEELDNKFANMIIWSGYIIDWVAGSHLPKQSCLNISDAVNYIHKKDTFVKSVELTNIKSVHLKHLFSTSFISPSILSYEEQIEASYHLKKYTAPHLLYKGFNYVLPVMNRDFFSFFLSLHQRYRKGCNLYKKMLLSNYQELFSLPTKTNLGLPLNASKIEINFNKIVNKGKKVTNKFYPIFTERNANYLDFNNGIREREDLKKVIYESVMDLKKRKIVDWIDIDNIWDEHIKRKVNHADALLVLASLEIHLKAGKIFESIQ
ncbi:MAG: hypothetical protein K8S23_10085 [Candidatus Cloacimonetes bacterium]|nr:hypothetical protein [Candidatus Cloacimonadota bacterium]